MKHIFFGVAGILSFLFFTVGFLMLIIINPQVLAEFDNLGFSHYNIGGMDGQLLAIIIIYVGTGTLSLAFNIGLIIEHKNSTQMIIGLSFLAISSIIWISFGLISSSPDEIGTDENLVLLRIIIFLITSIFGFMLVGMEFVTIKDQSPLKWTTLTVGLIIGTLGILSAFVLNDDTWLRTNLSIALFFVWNGTTGTFMIKKNKNR